MNNHKKEQYNWNKFFYIFFLNSYNILLIFNQSFNSNSIFKLFLNYNLINEKNNYRKNICVIMISSPEKIFNIIKNIKKKRKNIKILTKNKFFSEKQHIHSTDLLIIFKDYKVFNHLNTFLIEQNFNVKLLFEFKISDLILNKKINYNLKKTNFLMLSEKNILTYNILKNIYNKKYSWVLNEINRKKNKIKISLNLIKFKFNVSFSDVFFLFKISQNKKFVVLAQKTDHFFNFRNFLLKKNIVSAELCGYSPKDFIIKNIKLFNSKITNILMLTENFFYSKVILSKIDLREVSCIFSLKYKTLISLNIRIEKKFLKNPKKYSFEMFPIVSNLI